MRASHGEVEGWPVPQDGQAIAEADGPHTFRMQVHPNGNVGYVDDAGVDGIGYLRYTVNLAWPTPGAEPQVCTRSRAVQQAILKALAATDCAVLTWEQLASIRALDAQLEVSEGTDFAGLTGLESVSLKFGDVVPLPSTLAQLPRLRDLELMLNLQEALPEGFLSRNSHLKGLTIGSPDLTSLPAEFLAYIPQLTHLSLDIPQLEALPNHFLAQSPSLMSFRLNAPQLQTVSREVRTLLKAHTMQVVVVGPGQNFHTGPTSQSATEEWARPGQRLEIMTRLETEEGNWVQVKGHWQDFGVGDVSVFLDWRRWLEESHLAPRGHPVCYLRGGRGRQIWASGSPSGERVPSATHRGHCNRYIPGPKLSRTISGADASRHPLHATGGIPTRRGSRLGSGGLACGDR